jgi:hypothetical protein
MIDYRLKAYLQLLKSTRDQSTRLGAATKYCYIYLRESGEGFLSEELIAVRLRDDQRRMASWTSNKQAWSLPRNNSESPFGTTNIG